jgi:hypothetical protein
MYNFAIVALLAVGTVKLVDFLSDTLPIIKPYRSLLTFVVGIGAVLALDYSLFASWGVAVRNRTMGVWITGFVVAGMTVAWRAVFAYLTHDRATLDESLGEHRPLRKAA